MDSFWGLQRVLLAGLSGPMLSAMESLLCAAGARIRHARIPLCGESISRQLHEGRYACVIVPDLSALAPGGTHACFSALDLLLGEAREAGVPLAILLASSSTPDAAQLFSHAMGWAQGMFGDPVSVQCIRHTGKNAPSVCHQALALGARFLAGEHACTGVFAAAEQAETSGLPPAHPMHASRQHSDR